MEAAAAGLRRSSGGAKSNSTDCGFFLRSTPSSSHSPLILSRSLEEKWGERTHTKHLRSERRYFPPRLALPASNSESIDDHSSERLKFLVTRARFCFVPNLFPSGERKDRRCNKSAPLLIVPGSGRASSGSGKLSRALTLEPLSSMLAYLSFPRSPKSVGCHPGTRLTASH